jgi:hypothetical protein
MDNIYLMDFDLNEPEIPIHITESVKSDYSANHDYSAKSDYSAKNEYLTESGQNKLLNDSIKDETNLIKDHLDDSVEYIISKYNLADNDKIQTLISYAVCERIFIFVSCSEFIKDTYLYGKWYTDGSLIYAGLFKNYLPHGYGIQYGLNYEVRGKYCAGYLNKGITVHYNSDSEWLSIKINSDQKMHILKYENKNGMVAEFNHDHDLIYCLYKTRNNCITGSCIINYPNGDQYAGQYRIDPNRSPALRKHGSGILKTKLEHITGQFNDDYKHGVFVHKNNMTNLVDVKVYSYDVYLC